MAGKAAATAIFDEDFGARKGGSAVKLAELPQFIAEGISRASALLRQIRGVADSVGDGEGKTVYSIPIST